jgi:Uma2 family endonuclease
MTQQLSEPKPLALSKRTFEEYLEWALDTEAGRLTEWVDGEVVFMSPVTREHQDIGLFLLRVLSEYVEAKQLGAVFGFEFLMRLRTRPSGRAPDVMFIANSSLSKVTHTYLDGPADLVIEIVSPDSAERDRVTKYEEYRQAGVREYWWADPATWETKFYQLQPDGSYLEVEPNDQGIYHSLALPGFWLDVNWLWQRPMPTLASVRAALGLP